ncbi:lipopolysaccharide biosynthesis protein [Mastigocoleus testarum]|uniref:lipopolysaccharide biosynthesis protein n=1 Tax=Mastigocoleus testarum TaxID=996925 RepID=UPI000B080396|nr:oligosaccharide flippase family protein [Mastigocoleus testarum]
MKKIKIHPKLKSLIGVLSANVFNNFSSFAITIFAARLLGPTEFAKLALAVAITVNLSTFLDFGTSIALVRLYNASTDIIYKSNLIRVINQFKYGLLIIICLLIYPATKLIINNFPILKGMNLLIYLAIISGGLHSIWKSTRAIEQSQKDFRSFNIYTWVYGFLRLFVVLFLLVVNHISIISIFASLYFLPLLILTSFKNISSYISKKSKNKYAQTNKYHILKSILSYGFWVGISTICFTLLSQIPQFTLATTTDADEVGIYSAALTFIPIFILTNDAIRTIILPDVSAINSLEERKRYKKIILDIAPIFFGLMLVILVIMSFTQYFILGNSYQASIPVFIILGIGMVIVMYLGYLNILVHSIGVPHIDALINISRAFILCIATFILPKSAIWMAGAYTAVSISGEIVIKKIINIYHQKYE